MLKYTLKRLGLAVLSFLIIISIVFVLIRILPNPITVDSEELAELIRQRREQLGLYDPMIIQYFRFLTMTLFGGNWGLSESVRPGHEVTVIFASHLPQTVVINMYAMIVSVPIGLTLGVVAAIYKNKAPDQIISITIMLGIAVPSFVLAVFAQYIFFFRLGWFPQTVDPTTGWAEILHPSVLPSLIMPIMILASGPIAGLARNLRAELTESITSDYMLLARAKGLSYNQAIRKHAMREAMVPILPGLLAGLLGIFSGSVIVERAFSIRGAGALFLDAIHAVDHNLIILLTAFFTVIALLATLVVELSYSIIDPRIKVGMR